jgi:hypothetical protein
VKYLLVLGLILAAIGAVVWVVATAFQAASRGVRATSRGASGLAAWIGRKHYRVIPVIPAELAQTSSIRPDWERGALSNYEPPILAVTVRDPVTFNASKTSALREWPAVSTSAYLEDLETLLQDISTEPAYESLFVILNQQPEYPVEPPTEPPEPPPPPSWSRREIALPDPSIALPYYGPVLAFFNRFVDAAHGPQRELVAKAQHLKQTLKEEAETRNRQMEKLARKAQAKGISGRQARLGRGAAVR